MVDVLKKNAKKIAIVVTILLIIGIACGAYFILQSMRKNYELEKVTQYSYFLLNEDSLMGVININGEIVIQPNYENVQIPNPSRDVFICLYDYNNETKSYRAKALNKNGQQLFTDYDDVYAISIKGITSSIPYEKSVLKYRKDGKYGLIDFTGKEITKPIYDDIQGLMNKEGELLVIQNGKAGIINIKGVTLVEIHYNAIIADGYYSKEKETYLSGYIVTENGKQGYIGNSGNRILKTEYDSIERVNQIQEDKQVYLLAKKDGKVGLTKNKKVLVDFKQDEIQYNDANKVFVLAKEDKHGLIDIKGTVILNTEYSQISFEGTYLSAHKDNQKQYFDMKGNILNTVKYKNIFPTDNQNYYITVNDDDFYGIADKEGNSIVANNYMYIEYAFADYFIVSDVNEKFGVIDSKENRVIPIAYDVLQKIQDSKVIQAIVSEEKRTELFAKNMVKIASVTEAQITIEENKIQVYTPNSIQYFNLDGALLSAKDAFPNNTLFRSVREGKWGYVDKEENIKVEYIYDQVTEFNSYGFAGIKKDGKWGVIKQDGQVLLEPTYLLDSKIKRPEFIGRYYKTSYGYGETYYTANSRQE